MKKRNMLPTGHRIYANMLQKVEILFGKLSRADAELRVRVSEIICFVKIMGTTLRSTEALLFHFYFLSFPSYLRPSPFVWDARCSRQFFFFTLQCAAKYSVVEPQDAWIPNWWRHLTIFVDREFLTNWIAHLHRRSRWQTDWRLGINKKPSTRFWRHFVPDGEDLTARDRCTGTDGVYKVKMNKGGQLTHFLDLHKGYARETVYIPLIWV